MVKVQPKLICKMATFKTSQHPLSVLKNKEVPIKLSVFSYNKMIESPAFARDHLKAQMFPKGVHFR